MATNPHIYVSSVHGTNTGGSDTSYASQQTGAMTSLTAGNVYDNIGSAIAGASPSNGDTIYVADNHNASYDNTTDVVIVCDVISVDASNIENYKPGASENLTDTTDDFRIGGSGDLTLAGLTLETGDNTLQVNGVGETYTVQDCTIIGDTAGDYVVFCAGDSTKLRFVNVDIQGNNDTVYCMYLDDCNLEWYGGSISTITNVILAGAFVNTLIVGVDISPVTNLVLSLDSVDTPNHYIFNQCTLNSSVTIPTITGNCQKIELYNCDDTTSDNFHRFIIRDYYGKAVNNDSTYVTNTKAWSYDGSTKSSIEVTTTANCSHSAPFVFELPAQYIDLSSTFSNTIYIDLITTHATAALDLTNTDIAVFLNYPDSASAVTSNWVTSGKTVGTGNYGTDPLSSGDALTNDGGLGADDWTGETGDVNYYRIAIDTSTDPGLETLVIPRIEIYNNSIDGTNYKLFIHPIMSVG